MSKDFVEKFRQKNIYFFDEKLPGFFDLGEFSSFIVICDHNTELLCYPKIKNLLPQHKLFSFPAGEFNKNLDTCTKIWSFMTKEKVDRKALVINLGGGVVCDMGGFCAASYKRGISFVHFPTTLLAQVDASVGGKLGIDFENYKNQIGLFQEPDFIILCRDFLKTIPSSELRNGLAEVTKHALINSNEDWAKHKQIKVTEIPSLELIKRSVEIKKKIVIEDMRERSVRKKLNFGHTIGHAVESFFLQRGINQISHGEAVAVGIIAEAFLSNKYLGLSICEMKDICNYIICNFPRIDLSEIDRDFFVELVFQDKKNIGGAICASLLKNIGNCVIDVPVSPESCFESIKFYLEQYQRS